MGVLVASSAGAARAQGTCGDPPDMLITLDRSGSMSQNNKWTDARTAISSMVTTYDGSIRFGLIFFPTSGTCNVNKIAVTVGDNRGPAIIAALNAETPAGKSSPIAQALAYGNAYLGLIDPTKTKFVLLITDGYEGCTLPSTTVAQVTNLLNNGVKTYVVGFGAAADVNATVLNQMATAGGTALPGTTKYYEATNLTQLSAALQSIAANLSCCGNGVLDPGELCDTGIGSGPGSCPTSCNDNDPCTNDGVSGNGCQQQCSYTPVAPQNNDGCCPAGANSINDNDCPVVCGNGLLETGEQCDTGIPSGPGKCPTAADCNDNDVCTADSVTGSGCSQTCQNTPIGPNLSTPDGCCPAGATSLTDADCSPNCGNGVLESGEQCDTGITTGLGKCPTASDCNDNNVCTADSISGSGCSQTCSNTAIQPNLGTPDGCCPPGATSLTDADCPPVCGNGLLEAGETCDTGITQGPGKCPTSCDDGNVCTTDTLTGSACTAQCSNTPKGPSGTTKDGCCPSGATSLTDADCPPVCGNGLLESGELCDPGIVSGVGKCPTLADCNDNDVCTQDSLTGSGCGLSCRNTALTASLAAKDGCCPAGANALTDSDCTPVCGNGALEPGESCDTGITSGPGKCPTVADCNDNDSCTADNVSGSRCSQTCSNPPLAPNASVKDNCCPAGATAANDADCLASCGNGTLEPGETCDPGITSGSGACPTLASCDDGKACTKDTLGGGACSQSCKHTALTASLGAADGCCPAGATSLTDTDCKPVCGNGVVEAGETCDSQIASGPGACVTVAACNDNDACTVDAVGGSACTRKCTHTPQTPNATTKDSCCPPGANANTDADCAPVCGNGVLETGEKCDPGITSGAGTCPTTASCDDKDPCTVDTLVGGGCAQSCVHSTKLASLTTSDGCCPPGASAATDADCTSVCGNGRLEPGETCDTAIQSGAGKCTSKAACDDNDACTADVITGTGCTIACTNTALKPDAKAKDGCCPKGNDQTTDADCPPPCDPDRTTNCVDLCDKVKCPSGERCLKGKCIPLTADAWGSAKDAGVSSGDAPAGDGVFYSEPAGCSCELGSARGRAAAAWRGGLPLVLAALLFGWARRRRRRRRRDRDR